MPNIKSGEDAVCPSCGSTFYRRRCEIRTNVKHYCSLKCAGVGRSGENNPFFGRKHSPEVIAKIAEKIRANPPKGTGPKKGVFKHTPEARAKMSAFQRERWRTQRADMLSWNRRVGQNARHDAINNEPRHKFIFTDVQKREWLGTCCAWCSSVDELVIDHILPVICGGMNIRENAQTLCGDCNRWKMKYVDRPLYNSLVGHNRGSDS